MALLRAGDRARTGDNQLGRLKLYQLSYSRNMLVLNVLFQAKKPQQNWDFSLVNFLRLNSLLTTQLFLFCGLDGTRTRDPMRDRHVF